MDFIRRCLPFIRRRVGSYDPRRHLWFVAASSGPKDVVLVIDINVSKSMFRYGRMNIARDAAETIVDTRGAVHDRFTVIFSNETMIFDEEWKTIDVANQNGAFPTLIHATTNNKEKMKNAIRENQKA